MVMVLIEWFGKYSKLKHEFRCSNGKNNNENINYRNSGIIIYI